MQHVVDAITLGSIYCLFAVGLSLTWGTLNVLNVAHGAVFMFSGFTCYLVTQRAGLQLALPWLILLALLCGAIIEFLLDVVVFRAIRRRAADLRESESSMLIASVGATAIPVTIAAVLTDDSPFTITKSTIGTSVYHFGSFFVTGIEITIVAVALVTTVGLALWIGKSRNGRALRALSFDAETSALMGINQGRLSALVLFISGISAGAAGVFMAIFLTSLTPESGQDLLLKGFAAVVLGGVGSVWGSIIGAFVLAIGETAVTATTNGLWTEAVSFAIIIVILLVRPNGLLGRGQVDRA